MGRLLPVQVAQVEVDRHPADHRKQGDVDLASQMEVLLCQADDALALEQVVAPLHPRPPGVLLALFLRPSDRVLVAHGRVLGLESACLDAAGLVIAMVTVAHSEFGVASPHGARNLGTAELAAAE